MRIARGIFSRYNNLIFAVLEVRWRAYYNMVLNFVEVFALIVIIADLHFLYIGVYNFYPAGQTPESGKENSAAPRIATATQIRGSIGARK